MDNASTTRVSDEVLAAMQPYFCAEYGNPSADIYPLGRAAAAAVANARAVFAAAIGAAPDEIYFTSGGTESDNWAISGAVRRRSQAGKRHIVSSEYEHHAVLNTVNALKKDGYEVSLVRPGADGIIDPAEVKKAIRPDTAIVSIMHVNNEIGTINPIAEIAAVCHEAGLLFHSDAVQSLGHTRVNVGELGADMLSFSGHKLYAPKGIGALYIKKGVRIANLCEGGQQERGRRPGTENVPYIVGLAAAAEAAVAGLEEENGRVKALRDRLAAGLLAMPGTRLNGDRLQRVCGNANISFEGVEGESLLLMLAAEGIMASTGSACASHSLDPSHVLLSIGLPHEIAHGSLRFSLGRYNTGADVDYILEKVPAVVTRLREMSPIWGR